MSELARQERRVKRGWARPGSTHDVLVKFAKFGLPALVGIILALFYVQRHGTAATTLLGDARTTDDLGEDFGAELTEREVGYLREHEWAMTADDILWRRTKCGLSMTQAQRARSAGGAFGRGRQVALPGAAILAGRAQCRFQLAVHVDQPLRPRAFVQVVDILRDDHQLARPCGVEPGQRVMRRIGLDPGQCCAPEVVETMDQLGIARERLRGADLFDAMAFPQTVRATEGRKAAFGGNAGTGQHDDRAR